jgi:hypothetical protein
MKHAAIVVATVSAIAATLHAMPAQAQNTRSFVAPSPAGQDSNNCALATPCRTLAVAISKTNAGGEIDILGTAGYGSFTINKAISIVNPGGVEAGIAVGSGGTGITINVGPVDTVILRGLTIEGAGIGLDGIKLTAGGRLEIIDSVVRNFTDTGIIVAPSGNTSLLISNAFVLDNANAGIYLTPQNTNGSVGATIDRVTVTNNNYGIYMDIPTPGQSIVTGSITNSIVNQNNTAGLAVTRGNAIVHVTNTTLWGNTTGISLSAIGAIYLSKSTISQNLTGINITQGDVLSAGNNDINVNSTQINGTLLSSPEL